MIFFSSKCFSSTLANEPPILNLSTKIGIVINFIFGASANTLLYNASSKNTALFALSLTLPLVHFFLPYFDEEAAALDIASFVFLPAYGYFPILYFRYQIIFIIVKSIIFIIFI